MLLRNEGTSVDRQDNLHRDLAWFSPLLTMSCLVMARANAPRSLEGYLGQQRVALSTLNTWIVLTNSDYV